MPRYVLAHTTDDGHFIPMSTVATKFVDRGLDVTLVTTSQFDERARDTGARVVLSGGLTERRVADRQADRDALSPGPEQLNFDIKSTFLDPVPDQFAAISAEVGRDTGEPVVLIADEVYAGAWPFALGAPGPRPAAVITLGMLVMLNYSTDVAPFGMKLPPDASSDGRAANAERYTGFRSLFAPAQERLAQVMEQVGAPQEPASFFDAAVLMTDRYLQLCPPGLEYPRSDLSASVRFIGSLPSSPRSDRPLPSWWPDVEAADRVVVVTQGTLQTHDLGALVQPTLDGLAGEDVLVVATTGPAGAVLEKLPANARAVEFIPFDQLLPHADVLVTNGGFGGVTKALAHGVPIVACGATEDKPEVAARVAWSGVGIDLGGERPDPETVREAVLHVLRQPSYAEAAARLKAENDLHHPYDEILAAADEVIAGL